MIKKTLLTLAAVASVNAIAEPASNIQHQRQWTTGNVKAVWKNGKVDTDMLARWKNQVNAKRKNFQSVDGFAFSHVKMNNIVPTIPAGSIIHLGGENEVFIFNISDKDREFEVSLNICSSPFLQSVPPTSDSACAFEETTLSVPAHEFVTFSRSPMLRQSYNTPDKYVLSISTSVQDSTGTVVYMAEDWNYLTVTSPEKA